ncbi:hypothetical protein DAEQUDRAFT_720749 [Daedalea quercina L-15889]|uniref:DUF6697 domain-containing protein n=1 Tax=Daedalea quercina L-15889 TaxID=1314783 RepID=A0A165U8X3_9APHY|nr:hypothetical protein DAEQUDRAFT_720749 [Daedalea quercina L-15889]
MAAQDEPGAQHSSSTTPIKPGQEDKPTGLDAAERMHSDRPGTQASGGESRTFMSHILLRTFQQVKHENSLDDSKSGKTELSEGISLDEKPDLPATTAQVLSEEDLKGAVSQLKNPAIKMKKDSLFTWKVVTDRLQLVGLARHPIAVNDATRDFTFNRHYLHNLYGGSFVDTFLHPESLKVQFTGVDDFMCLRLDYNPHAPVNPGDPGLLFTYRSADRFAKYAARVNRVFVRTKASPALWQYMGQYRLYTSESLTKDEFASQPPVVRKTWAKAVLTRKQGGDICTRVHLRKIHGKEPAQGEVSKVAQEKKSLKQAKNQLTWSDIAAAYERGEEEIRVYAMKCVGYDAKFQSILAQNYKNFSPPTGKQKPKFQRTSREMRTGEKATTNRKRKRDPNTQEPSEESDGDMESAGAEEEEEEEMSDIDKPHYVPRATRSRPNAKLRRVRTE